VSETGIISRGGGQYGIAGELTFATVPGLWRSAGDNFGRDGPVRVDLAGITRVDSAGIALLIELTKAVRRHGGAMRLEHAPPQLIAIATVSGLDEVLPFVHEDAAAGI
jgi:phospholipid transport system transporter-binding protein